MSATGSWIFDNNQHTLTYEVPGVATVTITVASTVTLDSVTSGTYLTGITINEDSVTLSRHVDGIESITVDGAYTVTNNAQPIISNYTLTVDDDGNGGKKAAVTGTATGVGYTVTGDANTDWTVNVFPVGGTVTVAEITGLGSGATDNNVTLTGTTITVGQDALGTGKVTLTDIEGDYSLALATGVATETTVTYAWNQDATTNTTANYIKTESVYYTVDDGKNGITYHDVNTSTVLTVAGLKDADSYSKLAAPSDDKKITLKSEVLPNSGSVTLTKGTDVTGNYTLVLADGIKSSQEYSTTWVQDIEDTSKYTYYRTAPLYYTGDGTTTVTYNMANTDTDTTAVLTGLKENLTVKDDGSIEGITINTTTKIVTLTKDVFKEAGGTVTLSGTGYKFDSALPEGLEGTATSSEKWELDGSTWKYNVNATDYYTRTDTEITYHAATTPKTWVTLSGEGLKLTNDTLEGVTVTHTGYNVTTSAEPTTFTVNLTQDALETIDGKSVTVASGSDYSGITPTLTLSNVIESMTTNYVWSDNKGTVDEPAYNYVQTDHAYYDKDGLTVTYHSDVYTTEATLSGLALAGKTLTFAKKGTEAAASANVILEEVKDGETITGYNVTLKAGALNLTENATVSLTDVTGYDNTLFIDGSILAATSKKVWSVSGGTATYKEVKPEYYDYDSTTQTYTYHAGSTTILATISGLKVNDTTNDVASITGITITGNVIKLDDSVLNAEDVNIENGTVNGTGYEYKLALASGKTTTVELDTNSVQIDTTDISSGVAYLQGKLKAGYTVQESGNIQYTAADNAVRNIGTIDGLATTASVYDETNNTGTIVLNGKTITLKKGALNGQAISLSTEYDGYKIALDSNILTAKGSATKQWSVTDEDNTKTANYKNVYEAYYTKVDDKNISCTTPEEELLAVITGLDAATKASDDKTELGKDVDSEFKEGVTVSDKKFTFNNTANILGTGTVSLNDNGNGYTMELGSGLAPAEKNSAGTKWSLADGTATYEKEYTEGWKINDTDSNIINKVAEGYKTEFTVSGLKTGVTLDAEGKVGSVEAISVAGRVVTVTDALYDKTANGSFTLTDGYTLKLTDGGEDVADEKQTTAGTPVWNIDDTTATYQETIPAYVIYDTTTKTYNYTKADPKDLITITGLSGLTAGTDDNQAKVLKDSETVISVDGSKQVTIEKTALPNAAGSFTVKFNDSNYSFESTAISNLAPAKKTGTNDYSWAKDESNNAVYKVAVTPGYDHHTTESDGTHTFTYNADTTTDLVKISGLKSSALTVSNNAISGITIETNGLNGDIKLGSAVLPDDNSTVEIKLEDAAEGTSYTLALDTEDPLIKTSASTVKLWKANSTTAGTYDLFTNETVAYYNVATDNKSITYVPEVHDANKFIQVSGLASGLTIKDGKIVDSSGSTDELVTISGRVITLKSAALPTSPTADTKIELDENSLKDGYTLALDGVTESTYGAASWTWDDTDKVATYGRAVTAGYYSIDGGKSIGYRSADDTEEVLTISGLNATSVSALDDIQVTATRDSKGNINGYKVTLPKSVLGTSEVELTSMSNTAATNTLYANTLALGTDVDTSAKSAEIWAYDETDTDKVVYKEVNTAYYTLDGNTITTHTQTDANNPLFSIDNIKNGLAITTDVFGKSQIAGIKINGTTLTLDNSVFKTDYAHNAEITLTDENDSDGKNWEFKLGTNVDTVTGFTESWATNNGSATYLSTINDSGYKLVDANTIKYSKVGGTDTLATLTNIVGNADNTDKIAGINVNGTVFTLSETALGTADVNLFNAAGSSYTLNIASDATLEDAMNSRSDTWTVNGNIASFAKITPKYYTIEDSTSQTIVYHEQAPTQEYVKISGFSNLDTQSDSLKTIVISTDTITLNNDLFGTNKLITPTTSSTPLKIDKADGEYVNVKFVFGSGVDTRTILPDTWTKTGNTAYFVGKIDPGYEISNNQVKYFDNTTFTHATLTGLTTNLTQDQVKNGITYKGTNSDTFVLSNAILSGTSTVTLSNGQENNGVGQNGKIDYKLEIGGDVATSTTKFNRWDYNETAGSGTYTEFTPEYYSLRGKTITHNDEKSTGKYLTITGLASGFSGFAEATDSNASKKVITLGSAALAQTDVTLTNYGGFGYKLALSTTGVASPTDGSNYWGVIDGTATYAANVTSGYELKNNGTFIDYTDSWTKKFATITGINTTGFDSTTITVNTSGNINTITLGAALLNGEDIYLNKGANAANNVTYTFGNTLDSTVFAPVKVLANQASETRVDNTYNWTAEVTSGYNLVDSTHIHFNESDTKVLASITGLGNNVNGFTTTTETSGNYTYTIFHLSGTMLNGATVNLKDEDETDEFKFKFAIDNSVVQSDVAVVGVWSSDTANTTAIYSGKKPEYYTLDLNDTQLTYHAEADRGKLATIEGLDSDWSSNTVKVNGNVITISAEALTANSPVNLSTSNGYILALDSNTVKTPTDVGSSTFAWSAVGNYAYLNMDVTSGYSLANSFKTIEYVASTQTQLASLFGINVASTTNIGKTLLAGDTTTTILTLSSDTLSKQTITLTDLNKKDNYNFQLKLADNVNTSTSKTHVEWTFDGGKATYNEYRDAFYTLDNDKTFVSFEDEHVQKQLLQISGLNTGLTASATGVFEFNAASNTITLGTAALTASDVALIGSNYKLKLDNVDGRELGSYALSTETNKGYLTAVLDSGYTLVSDYKITYAGNTETSYLATVTGIKTEHWITTGSKVSFDTGTKIITLSNDVLDGKDVIVTKGDYELDLAAGVATSTTSVSAWKLDNNTPTFYTNIDSEYYSDTGKNIIYKGATKGTAQGKIQGLNTGLTYDVSDTLSGAIIGYKSDTGFTAGFIFESATNKITINNKNILPTVDNATVKFSTDYFKNYTFALGDGITASSETAKWFNVTGTNSKSAEFKVAHSAGYELASNSSTITHHVAGTDTFFTLSGLSSSYATGTSIEITTMENRGIKIIADGANGDKDINDGKATVQLSSNALGTSQVSIKGDNYVLDIDTANVNTRTDKYDYKWIISGSTARYSKVRSAYYSINAQGKITYTDDSVVATLATLTGLKSGLKEFKDDNGNSVIGTIGENDAKTTYITIDNTYNSALTEITGGTIKIDNREALNNAAVKLTSGTGYTYEFAELADTFKPTADTSKYVWSVSGTTATLKGYVSEGYTLANDKKSIAYSAEKAAGSTILTINNLKSGLEVTNGAIAGITLGDDNTITLTQDVLGTSNVTISNANYKLALDGAVPTKTVNKTFWTVKNTTFTYQNEDTAYYTYDATNNKIIYNKPTNNNTYLTVSGNALKSDIKPVNGLIEGVMVDASGKVILSNSVFATTPANGQKVTISGKTSGTSSTDYDYTRYTLELAPEVDTPQTGDPSWRKGDNATSATYTADVTAGYTKATDNKSISYAASTTKTYATLNGLTSTKTEADLEDKVVINTVTEGDNSTNTVVLNKDILNGTSKVTIKGTGYVLGVDNTVDTDSTITKNVLTANNSKVAYYQTVTPQYYTVTNSAITKVNQKTTKTLATISGLNDVTATTDGKIAGITIDDDAKEITLSKSVIPSTTNNSKVSLSGSGYKLALDSDATAPVVDETSKSWSTPGTGKAVLRATSSAGYVLSTDGKSVTYKAAVTYAADAAAIVTVSGLSTNVKADTINTYLTLGADNVITLKKDALSTSTVNVDNSAYTLALDTDVIQEVNETDYWTASGSNYVYQSGQGGYYEYVEKNNSVVYHQPVKNSDRFQITGLKAGLEVFTDDMGEGVIGSGTNVYATVRKTGTSGTGNSQSDVMLVTITKDALPEARNGGRISITDKNTKDNKIYKLALDDSTDNGVKFVEEGEATWVVSGTTATYCIPKSEGYDYTDSNSTTAVYYAATSTVLATITGLNNKIDITSEEKQAVITSKEATKGTAEEVALKKKMEAYLNDNTVATGTNGKNVTLTLPPDILSTAQVSLTKDKNTAATDYTFTLALDGDVAQKAETVTGWNVTSTTANSTATYQTYNKGYYTLNPNNTTNRVTYTRDTAPQTLLTVSGLASGLTVTNGAVESTTTKDGTTTTTYYYGEIDGISIDDDNSKVSLSESVLPTNKAANSRITISGLNVNNGTNYSKYQLQLDDSLKANNVGAEELKLNGSSVVLRDNISEGYNISTDGKTLTYAVAKTGTAAPAIFTLNGLNLNVTAAEIAEYIEFNGGDSATAKTKILDDRIAENISVSDNIITLKNGILGTANVTLVNGTKDGAKSAYTLELDGEVNQKAAEKTHEWVINGTTAFYRYFEKAYYEKASNGTTITYKAPQKTSNLITLNGLKSGLTVEDKKIDGIDLNESTHEITLSSDVLGTSNVSVSGIQNSNSNDDYRNVTLGINGDVDTEAYQNTAWTVNGTTATYKTYETGYYALNATKKGINYIREKTVATLATVTGLKNGTTADKMAISGNKIVLDGDMVGTTNVRLTNGKDAEGTKQEFKLEKGTEVTTSTGTVSTWTVSGTSATNKTYNNGYFSQIGDESWTYTPDTNATDTIVISGLKSGLKAEDLTADEIEITTDKVTIKKDSILADTTVSLTGRGAYSDTTLALSVQTDSNMADATFSVSGSSILYTTKNQSAYYKKMANGKSYTYRKAEADKPTLFTINGLNVNVINAAVTTEAVNEKASNGISLADAKAQLIDTEIKNYITPSGMNVELKKGILGTAKQITLTQGSNELGVKQEYQLALNNDVNQKEPGNTLTTSWSVSGTNANYNQYKAGYYTLDTGTKLKVTYTADANRSTLATITGLKSGLTVTDGKIDGIDLNTTNNTITLDQRALGTTAAKVALTTGKGTYTLALDTTSDDNKVKVITKDAVNNLAWNTNTSKTASYSNGDGFYTPVETNTAVTYTAVGKDTLASVTVNKENILFNDGTDTKTVKEISIQTGATATNATVKGFVLAKADVGNNTTFNINGNGAYAFSFASDVESATVTGAATADTIKSEGKNMTFNTAAGDDVINAEGSITLISAGAGNDLIIYNPTTDNKSAGRINGEADSDTIYIGEHADGNLTISGGAGVDSINVAGGGDNRILGEADSDTIIVSGNGKNTVYGGAGHDAITVSGSGANLIYGDADSDTIIIETAATGDNTINGGAGVDKITVAGSGANWIYGEAGDDVISVSGGGKNTVSGGRDNDSISLGTGAYVVLYANGEGNDTISGFSADDTLKVTSGAVSAANISGNDLLVKVGNGTITLKDNGKGLTAGTSTFTYYNNNNVSSTVTVTAAATGGSGDRADDDAYNAYYNLAQSADLIYDDDDAFFMASDISELVDNSFDNYSLGDVTTQGIKELTPQEDMLTYGNDENTKK